MPARTKQSPLEKAPAMNAKQFDRVLSDINAPEKSKRNGVQWKFGAKPQGWIRLLDLASGLIESTTDERGNVIVAARYAELLQRDIQQLGHKLHAIALGANAVQVFKQKNENHRPEQQMQHINYAVAYWRGLALGLSPDAAAYIAQCHFPEFKPPAKGSIKRYASAHRSQAFAILETEGIDVTPLRRVSAARAKRGKQ